MHDWADPAGRLVNDVGAKVRVGRVAKSPYSDWRRTVGGGCYANDLDWVEWRAGADGAPRIVALIETTFYEDKPELRSCLPRYCAAALARFKRDGQYTLVMRAAAAFQVAAYFVVARYDVAVFFVCRLRDECWSDALTEQRYREWIRSL